MEFSTTNAAVFSMSSLLAEVKIMQVSGFFTEYSWMPTLNVNRK